MVALLERYNTTISTFKLVGFLVGCRKKKISLHDFGEKMRGKIRTSIVRGIVRDY